MYSESALLKNVAPYSFSRVLNDTAAHVGWSVMSNLTNRDGKVSPVLAAVAETGLAAVAETGLAG